MVQADKIWSVSGLEFLAMAMAMAVSCAHLNVLGPRVIASDASSSGCNAASGFLLRRRSYNGGRRSALVCRASGSRKEKDKRRGGKIS